MIHYHYVFHLDIISSNEIFLCYFNRRMNKQFSNEFLGRNIILECNQICCELFKNAVF